MTIKWERRTYSKEEFINAWQTSVSIAEVARKLNLTIYGSSYTHIRNTAHELELSDSHLLGQGHNLNKTKGAREYKKDIAMWLKEDTIITSNSLKNKLFKSGLKKKKCEECGIDNHWNGKELKLQLDHINGNNKDNRIENLKILCPNCHSQTITFCRAKNQNRVAKKENTCIDCKKAIVNSSTRCKKCHQVYMTKYSSGFIKNK